MRRAPARPVRACFVRSCCSVVVQEHDLRATLGQCNAKRRLSSHFSARFTPYTLHFTCTLHSTFALDTSSHLKSRELFSPHLSSSHLIPSLLTCHQSKFFSAVFISSEHWSTFLISSKFVSAHLSCSARQKALTVREKSLAQKNIGRRKFLHTDTWDTDAFRQKSFSEKLCTTKLAQSTSQYYFLLDSLHTARPSTTLYYKTCTKHVPVLLCTTKLAQSTPPYYFTRLPPQHKPHATFMQPLQCILQHHVANLHLSTHMATPDDSNHAAIPMRSATTHSRNEKNYAHRNNHSLQNADKEPITLGTTPAGPAAHRRYLSTPPAATLYGKIQGFVLRLPPQHKPHATFMQPLQCILQHHVANLHLSTHMATPADNNYAAIPVQSATTDSKHAKNYAHRNNHSWRNTKEEPITLGTTPAAPAAHKRYLSSPAVATLHRKTHGFVLRLPPQVKSHTTVSHHPSLSVLLCDVKSHTTVSHHTLSSVFLCDVKSRTALHWVYCYVMSSLTPQSHTTLHWVYSYVI